MQPFSYLLPGDRIAQRPVHPPESAKMLCSYRDGSNRKIEDKSFFDFPSEIEAGDLLVFNDTRVIRARLFGTINTHEVEILLLAHEEEDSWLVMGRPMRLFEKGIRVDFTEGLSGVFGERTGPQEIRMNFFLGGRAATPEEVCAAGVMPIPPYIRDGRADDNDVRDYQSPFARVEGSVAAPTASLHFTHSLVDRICAQGARVEFLTLHVGAASFLSLKSDASGALIGPGREQFVYSRALCRAVRATIARGHRVIAVGTTVARGIESMLRLDENTPDGTVGCTELFISPGFEFKGITALVTNFHQPGTSHLLLVEAILGREHLESTYRHALESGYRFLSYGDGMFVTL